MVIYYKYNIFVIMIISFIIIITIGITWNFRKRRTTMPGQQERMRLSSMGGESTCSNSSSGGSSIMMKIRRRVVMMGAARVGKTSIIKQFLYDQFPDRYKETIEELHRGKYKQVNRKLFCSFFFFF